MDKNKIYYTNAGMNKKHTKGFKSSSEIANRGINKNSVYEIERTKDNYRKKRRII